MIEKQKNSTKSKSTTQSVEILGEIKTKSQNTTQSIDVMDSHFITDDTSQQLLILSKSSSIASPIKPKPEKELNKEQFKEITFLNLEQEEHQQPLFEQIKKITFDKNSFKSINSQLNDIENFKQEVMKQDLKQQIKEIEKFEEELKSLVDEWQNISEQGVKFIQQFMETKRQKEHKQMIIQHIKKFHSEIENFFTDANCFTISVYGKKNKFLYEGDINLTVKFSLHTQEKKSDPIQIEILHSQQNQKYRLYLIEQAFLEKLKERMSKNKINDLQFWLDVVEKQSNSNSDKNHCFLYYEFERDTKLIQLQGQKDRPFIITKDSCPIYLGQNMSLKLEQNQQINVHYAQFTSQAQNEKFCLYEQKQIYSKIQDNSKDLIKLEYTKQLQNNKLSKNYEFFLRDQQLELDQYLPLFKGVLQHDSIGFMILPHENQRLKLYTDEILFTKQRQMRFSLELNDDVWIEVEYDLDKKLSLFDIE